MRGTDFTPEGAPNDRLSTAAEQARLDEAMQRADDLLVSSLKTDERRRKQRHTILFLIGGLAMIAIVCSVVVGLAMQNQPVPVAAVSMDQSDQLTREGWQLWRGQQFDQAAEKFEQAVKLAPKNTNAWNGLGWSKFNSGHGDEAIKSFQKVIALEPKHPAALNGLGQIALMKRNYKAAEKYLLTAAPQAPAAWYGLAKLYLLEGKFADARKWAQKIVNSEGADDGARQMLAAAKAKKLDDSLRRLIEPPAPGKESDAAQLSGKGWQLFNQGRNAEALEAFAAALEADPDNGTALNGIGWALLGSGQAAKAKPYFEKIVKANPDAAGAINGLARVLKIEGDVDGAVKLWEDMLKQFPGPNAATAGLAETYFERKEYAKAVPLLEQLAKVMPTNEQIKTQLDTARDKAGQ